MADPYAEFSSAQSDDPYAEFTQSLDDKFSDIQPASPQFQEQLRTSKQADRMRLGGDGSPVGAFADRAANTMLLNVPRNIAAGIDSLSSGKPFEDTYQQYKDMSEANARLNPKSATAGTVAGVVGGIAALPEARLLQGGLGLTGTVARAGDAALTGAGYAGGSELADTHDPLDAAIAAGLGAGLGLVASPIADKIGKLYSGWKGAGRSAADFLDHNGNLTGEAAEAARQAGIDPNDLHTVLSRAYAQTFADKGVSTAAAKEAAAGEFGLPVSPGQATGDFTNSQYEQAAARGAYGPQATQAARNFFDAQASGVDEARQGVQQGLAGNNPVMESVNDAATAVGSGLKQKAAADKLAYDRQYKQAFSNPGSFDRGVFESLGTKIKGGLSDEGVIVNPRLTPNAADALDYLDNELSRLKFQNKATGSNLAPSDSEIVGVNMKGLDQATKTLNKFYGDALSTFRREGKSADLSAMSAIKDKFEGHVQGALDNGLFDGSEKAIEDYRKANQMFSKYKKTFTKQGGGDDTGASVNRIIQGMGERDVTAGEIANMLYGKSVVGEKGVSSGIAQRVKKVFGEDSQEFSALKQGLWQRMTSKPEGMDQFGPQALSQKIFRFVNGDGADLAKVVYTPAELAQMRRFASVLKNTVPPKGSVNTSNTSYLQAALKNPTMQLLAAGMTHGTGKSLIKMGAGLLKDVVHGRAAERHFAKSAPSILPKPRTFPTGVGAGLLGAAGVR